MRKLHFRLFFACTIATLASVSACFLIAPLDDLYASADSDITIDGGVDASESDSTVSNDTGITTDATLEDTGPIISKFQCPDATYSKCDDFERTAVTGTWPSSTEQNGGVLSIATLSDGGRVLRSFAPVMDSGAGSARAFLQAQSPVMLSSFSIAADVNLNAFPLKNYINFLEVAFNPPTGRAVIYLSFLSGNNALLVQQDITGGSKMLTSPITLTPGPHHVEFHGNIGGSIVLSIDGSEVVTTPMGSFVHTGFVQVSPGFTSSAIPVNPQTILEIDNLVFTAH